MKSIFSDILRERERERERGRFIETFRKIDRWEENRRF